MRALPRNQRVWLTMLMMLLFTCIPSAPLSAQTSFNPPTTVRITMYQLNDVGGLSNPARLCSAANNNLTIFGCTVDPGHPYPYGSSQIDIPIETDYLLDVVPGESNPENGIPLTAVTAQAVAARTYVYEKINGGAAINNSIGNQLFVPYIFDRLGLGINDPLTQPISINVNPCSASYRSTNTLKAEQDVVCAAVAQKQYMTLPNSDVPIFSEFSGDKDTGSTVTSPVYSYLTEVADPISASNSGCLVNNDDLAIIGSSHGRGMLQRGASRWARGSRCWSPARGDVRWSVRFDRPEQILTHYYTGVHIRNTSKTIVTPANRWVPLKIDWGAARGFPPVFFVGSSYSVQIQIQNTGTLDWACNASTYYTLVYSWVKTGISIPGAIRVSVCGLAVGKTITIPLALVDVPATPAPYGIAFDIVKTTNGTDLAFSNASQNAPGGWQAYVSGTFVCLPSGCKTNLSLLTKGNNAALRSDAPVAPAAYPPPPTPNPSPATPNPYPPPATATPNPYPPPATATPLPLPTSTPAPTPYGGTFPSRSVRDNFNRANGALGSNWLGAVSGYQITSNAARAGNGGAIYYTTNYSPNQEAYVTLKTITASAQEIDLLLKAQDTSGCNVLKVWYQPRTRAVRVQTCRNQTWTDHGGFVVTYQAGDRFGARAQANGMVDVYKNATRIGSVQLTTAWPDRVNGGRIGIWTVAASATVLDDFGGGTLP